MKCPICKYLNTREEARKHLNKQTIMTLGNAHLAIAAVPPELLLTQVLNCSVHNQKQNFIDHLHSISNFSDELKAVIQLFPLGVPARPLQTLLNKYPDPRKDNVRSK